MSSPTGTMFSSATPNLFDARLDHLERLLDDLRVRLPLGDPVLAARGLDVEREAQRGAAPQVLAQRDTPGLLGRTPRGTPPRPRPRRARPPPTDPTTTSVPSRSTSHVAEPTTGRTRATPRKTAVVGGWGRARTRSPGARCALRSAAPRRSCSRRRSSPRRVRRHARAPAGAPPGPRGARSRSSEGEGRREPRRGRPRSGAGQQRQGRPRTSRRRPACCCWPLLGRTGSRPGEDHQRHQRLEVVAGLDVGQVGARAGAGGAPGHDFLPESGATASAAGSPSRVRTCQMAALSKRRRTPSSTSTR